MLCLRVTDKSLKCVLKLLNGIYENLALVSIFWDIALTLLTYSE